MGMNGGIIVGNVGYIKERVWYGYLRVYLQSITGEGPISFYDDKGIKDPFLFASVNGDGDFSLSFAWDPVDFGKTVVTALRFRMTLVQIVGNEWQNLNYALEGSLCLCVSFGAINFNPVEGYAGKWISIANDFYQGLRKLPIPPILQNFANRTPEMLFLNGFYKP
jgi:hypothetical protein